MSRHPTLDSNVSSITLAEDKEFESSMVASLASDICAFSAVTLEEIKQSSNSDPVLRELQNTVIAGFPGHKTSLPAHLQPFWDCQESLSIIDGVVTCNGRVIVPECLRDRCLSNLRCAHQGVTCSREHSGPSTGQALPQTLRGFVSLVAHATGTPLHSRRCLLYIRIHRKYPSKW